MIEDGLKIGVLFSQSGPMAVTENAHLRGVILACEEINADGGVLGRKLDPIILEPAGSDADFARLAAELLVRHRVNVIFGACLSTSRKAVLPVIERFNGILFYPSVYEGFEYSPNVIYGGAVPNQVLLPLLEHLYRNEGRRIALIGSDTLYAREVNRIVAEFLDESGGEIVEEIYAPIGSSDARFSVVLSRIADTNTDAIISTVVGEDSISLYNAFSAAGLRGDSLPIASLTTTESELWRMMPAARAGHISVASYFSTLAGRESQAFRTLYRERFGNDGEPSVYSSVTYSQVHMFADAVRQAGGDETEALMSALSGSVLKGPGGNVFLDTETNHSTLRPLIGRAAANGTFEIVWRGDNVIRPDPYLVSYDRSVMAREAG